MVLDHRSSFRPWIQPRIDPTPTRKMVRGHALRPLYRSAWNATRPARSLESVLSGNRRTTGHLHNPALGGDTHPGQSGQRSRLPDERGRHSGLGKTQRQNSGRFGRLHPLGLVQRVAESRTRDESAISRRQARCAEIPSPSKGRFFSTDTKRSIPIQRQPLKAKHGS
jgi:hypothetical protein